jgi:hypothetical protein
VKNGTLHDKGIPRSRGLRAIAEVREKVFAFRSLSSQIHLSIEGIKHISVETGLSAMFQLLLPILDTVTKALNEMAQNRQ